MYEYDTHVHATHCNTLHHTTYIYYVWEWIRYMYEYDCVAVCCSVLQCVAVRCSVYTVLDTCMNMIHDFYLRISMNINVLD